MDASASSWENALHAARLFLEAVFFGSYFAAAGLLVIAVYAAGLLTRRYSRSFVVARLGSAAVTTAFFTLNFIAFMPAVLLLNEAIESAYASFGIPRLDGRVWDRVPEPLLILLTLLLVDLANYWGHRWLHHPLLWPSHAIHHSDSRMTGLTNFRIHFLEAFLMGFFHVILLSWLALPGNTLPYAAMISVLFGVYIHMEMDWGHGRFAKVLASPRFHQWHHADVPAAYGKNLANMFPIMDIAFGTYHVPGPCAVPLGAHGVPERNIAGMLLYPFQEWTRMGVRAWTSALRRGERVD